MSKSRRAKQLAMMKEGLRAQVRTDLLQFSMVVVGLSIASLAPEFLADKVSDGVFQTATVMCLGASLALFFACFAFGVRAWRALVAAGQNAVSGGQKVLFALSLWFGAGLPMSIVNAIRCFITPEMYGDGTTAAVQVGIAVALLLAATYRFKLLISRS